MIIKSKKKQMKSNILKIKPTSLGGRFSPCEFEASAPSPDFTLDNLYNTTDWSKIKRFVVTKDHT